MYYLKLPNAINIMALVFLSLLSACDREQMFDGSNEHAVSPEVSTTPIPAIPQAAGQPTPQADSQPPAAEVRSADSLKLTIKETPFREAAPIGSGTTTAADWLESEGHAADLNKIPANDNLLPDLFNKKQREKAISVEMELLLDDGEQETSDVIDGAEWSIKYKTD
jgi:hypothetical protein